MEYIQRTEHSTGCFLCRAAGQDADASNLIVYRGQNVFVILNRYPYTSGHLMVVPFEHTGSIEALDSQTQAELMAMISRSLQALRKVYHPEAFNVGANIGEAAGAGVAEHLHFHVVPRWGGDTNFMSSLAGTRVLPEMLDDTCRRLTDALKEIGD
jgi:ATP adenylyltransferase